MRLRWHRDLRRWSVICRICPSLTSIPTTQDDTALAVLMDCVECHLREHAAGRGRPPFRFYYPAGS